MVAVALVAPGNSSRHGADVNGGSIITAIVATVAAVAVVVRGGISRSSLGRCGDAAIASAILFSVAAFLQWQLQDALQ